MRIITFSVIVCLFTACDPNTINQILTGEKPLTTAEVALGLKEALNFGISEGADKLSSRDGYYKSAYKILLPEQARKVTEKLSVIPGFTQVEEVILEKINRAAEDAAKSAKPIFVEAIREMTFQDAMSILMGNNTAATDYLNSATRNALYAEFQPVINNSLEKFNANKYWADAVAAYNKIPFVERMNPELDDYVTQRALDGLFDMVAKKEVGIRDDISQRTTDLLKRVFAKQDQ